MVTTSPHDPSLNRIRARDDHQRDSDYAIAGFPHERPDRGRERDRPAEFILALPCLSDALTQAASVMHENRRDGLRL